VSKKIFFYLAKIGWDKTFLTFTGHFTDFYWIFIEMKNICNFFISNPKLTILSTTVMLRASIKMYQVECSLKKIFLGHQKILAGTFTGHLLDIYWTFTGHLLDIYWILHGEKKTCNIVISNTTSIIISFDTHPLSFIKAYQSKMVTQRKKNFGAWTRLTGHLLDIY
jgi:hypothetical protein